MKNHLSSEAAVTTAESTICGAFAGLGTRAIIAPLDLVKIRLQVQPGAFSVQKVAGILSNAYKNEGITAFWKGNLPASFLYVTYSACQFGSLRVANQRLSQWSYTKNWPEPGRQFIAGAFSGMVSSAATYPFDLLRTRGAASTDMTQRLLHVIPDIWRTQGPRGFYHGASSAVVGIIPYMGSFFCIYSWLRDNSRFQELPIPKVLSASFIAGAVSKTIIMPLDTIRKRVQVQKAGHAPFFRTASHIVKTEGVSALYRGLSIACAKALPSSFFSMLFFEASLSTLRSLS